MKKKSQLTVRYFTRSKLIEASQLGVKWDFNRQVSESIAEVPDLKYPVVSSTPHTHRHGQLCEPHIRCVVSLGDMNVIVDVPTDFFDTLPTQRVKGGVI